MISFRLGPGGAQGRIGVAPDMTTMGKIIGGGFPVGAYASTEELMEPLAISDATIREYRGPKLEFSGTFNAHPISMAVDLAVMEEMKPSVYERMDYLGERMREGMKTILKEAGVGAFDGGIGSFFHVMWTPEKVKDYRTAATRDRVLESYFSLDLMNREGFLLGHPNVSAVTVNDDVDFTLEVTSNSVDAVIPFIKERAPHLLL